MGALSIWHWLVILAIVLVIFGTKKLRDVGSDLGGAIKNFKQAMKEEAEETQSKATVTPAVTIEKIEQQPAKAQRTRSASSGKSQKAKNGSRPKKTA